MHFYERVAKLESERVPFALALVVSRRAPVSSHLGDRAIVFVDGRMEGFVGGSCSRDIVRRHCVEALERGTPRLLHIRPEPAAPRDRAEDGGEHVFVPMSCASEGAVDVYVEPHVPARRLFVAGFTPVAEALARCAAALTYDVVRVVEDDELDERAGAPEAFVTLDGLRAAVAALSATERTRTIVVVASLGRYDEEALDIALDQNFRFVGLVASHKRAARVLGVLQQQGRSRASLASVRSPVGLDIGARSPGDVAVSILAEIVASSASDTSAAANTTSGAGDADADPSPLSSSAPASTSYEVDPVCGMDVALDGARHALQLEGRTYYFCGAGCRIAFAADRAAAPTSPGDV